MRAIGYLYLWIHTKLIQGYDLKGEVEFLTYGNNILDYIKDEYKREFDCTLSSKEVSLFYYKNTPESIPKQKNGYDCGVYCCCFVNWLLFGLPFPVSEEDLVKKRWQMARSILKI